MLVVLPKKKSVLQMLAAMDSATSMAWGVAWRGVYYPSNNNMSRVFCLYFTHLLDQPVSKACNRGAHIHSEWDRVDVLHRSCCQLLCWSLLLLLQLLHPPRSLSSLLLTRSTATVRHTQPVIRRPQ